MGRTRPDLVLAGYEAHARHGSWFLIATSPQFCKGYRSPLVGEKMPVTGVKSRVHIQVNTTANLHLKCGFFGSKAYVLLTAEYVLSTAERDFIKSPEQRARR